MSLEERIKFLEQRLAALELLVSSLQYNTVYGPIPKTPQFYAY